VLVPATMELLGEANWWLPRWLDRILPHLAVEGPAEPAPAGVPSTLEVNSGVRSTTTPRFSAVSPVSRPD